MLQFTCDGMSEADGRASLRRDAVSLMWPLRRMHTPSGRSAFTGSPLVVELVFGAACFTAAGAGPQEQM